MIKPSIVAVVVQRGAHPTLLRIVTQSLGLIALCVLWCGCNSIYHQTWATMPADAEARLALRLKEARDVERGARGAARQLLPLLQQGGNTDRIRVGFDRLEKEALELERRILAARDELGTGVEVRENSELEALNNQARVWRQFAIENRSVNHDIAARRLELLLDQ
jgi:hypothetical protein